MNTKNSNVVEEGRTKGGEKRGPTVDNENVWEHARWEKYRPMTASWLGRCLRELTRELRQNVGERTQHALRPRIEELHGLGLKADIAGKIVAHEYRIHSRLTKEKEAVARERDLVVKELRDLESKGGRPVMLRKGPQGQDVAPVEHFPTAAESDADFNAGR